jgi:hypothetical protein
MLGSCFLRVAIGIVFQGWAIAIRLPALFALPILKCMLTTACRMLTHTLQSMHGKCPVLQLQLAVIYPAVLNQMHQRHSSLQASCGTAAPKDPSIVAPHVLIHTMGRMDCGVQGVPASFCCTCAAAASCQLGCVQFGAVAAAAGCVSYRVGRACFWHRICLHSFLGWKATCNACQHCQPTFWASMHAAIDASYQFQL